MFVDIFAILTSLIRLSSRRTRQQSEPDVSQGLREQTVNIIDELVNEIAPGYLPPNLVLFRGYQEAIYKRVYKSLWDEFGKRCFENVNYRDEIFDFLREVSSEEFFSVTEYLLKEMYRIVHIQRTIPDEIILNPYAGEELWSRKESVRDGHIRRFKGAVDMLNHRLFQSNAEYRYELSGEFVQMVSLDAGLDVPEESNDIQEPGDNQTAEQHQKRSRSEFWNRRSYGIAVAAVIIALLIFLFGDGILRQPLHRVWKYLQTILNR